MKTHRTLALTVMFAVLIGLPLAAEWPISEKIDLDAVYRIKAEGLQHSKVMEIESYLTDVYGPRLTGSPNIKEAAEWAQKTMKEWGLTNVHLETWPFGRGWQNQRFVANAVSPRAHPLTAFPKAWTPGTKGPLTAEAVLAMITTDSDFDTYRGKLRGKFVLTTAMRPVDAHFEPLGHRYTDPELAELAMQPSGGGRGRGNFAAQQAFNRKRHGWSRSGISA
jgi:carboxypeptidase Q